MSAPETDRRAVRRRLAGLLREIAVARSPISFQLLGRVLLHAALVGAAAGALGLLFVAGCNLLERHTLERLAGYMPLLAAGESHAVNGATVPFRPWLLWAIPALGALAAGWISTRFAPATRGGGANTIIRAFHHDDGVVRTRSPFVKAIVSVLTLGSGGSGGREGPTMFIGGALGSIVGQLLRVSVRERRILLVAGTAAGMAAVFRTPLGAALLAVEVLHRDDFEAEALIPAILASVMAYSVVISVTGESTLFAHAPRYPLVPAHLPLYGVMAVVVSLFSLAFARSLDGVKHLSDGVKLPAWVKPGLGGLALGLAVTPVLIFIGHNTGRTGAGLGLLGGGYGAAQIAITGADWLVGWRGVELLVVLALVKLLATSLTVGSGGSAGDFGPSLVLGGLVGGAFGRVAQLLLHDPRIDPGAFALVGMGTFYGGIAHVPLASMVMVCELAGSYDLLVPLMLAEGIAFVAMRNHSLYSAQVPSQRESPAHRDERVLDVLRDIRVADVLVRGRTLDVFEERTPAAEIRRRIAASAFQDAFAVVSGAGRLVGVINAETVRAISAEPDGELAIIAHDIMVPPLWARESDDLHSVLDVLLRHGVRELLVVDASEKVVGLIDEAEITRAYFDATTARVEPAREGVGS